MPELQKRAKGLIYAKSPILVSSKHLPVLCDIYSTLRGGCWLKKATRILEKFVVDLTHRRYFFSKLFFFKCSQFSLL